MDARAREFKDNGRDGTGNDPAGDGIPLESDRRSAGQSSDRNPALSSNSNSRGERECPVPKPGGRLGQLLGFPKKQAKTEVKIGGEARPSSEK